MNELTTAAAFNHLIARGEEIIAAGRPATPFSDLQYHEPAPQRVACDLRALAAAPSPASLTMVMRPVYERLLAELQRFEPVQILFTSLEPGQGTTFTAANLAALNAENAEADAKILFAEFYSGTHENAEYLDKTGTLSRDAQTLENYLCSTPVTGLYRLAAAAGACELDGMTALWKRLQATFSRIFLDVSPAGYNPLFPWLAAKASGTVLIARKQPDGKIVKKFVDELTAVGGRFMGVIINA